MDNTDIHNETSAHTAHKLREKASGVSSELIVLTAHVVSSLYSPFYLPVVAFVVLFLFSYLNMLPMQTKVILTLIVYFFTILLPHVAIYCYRKLNGWTRHQMSRRERRYVPYVLSIVSYGALLYLLYGIHMPRFALGVIGGALVIQVVCAIVNNFIKSAHTLPPRGCGGGTDSLFVYLCLRPHMVGVPHHAALWHGVLGTPHSATAHLRRNRVGRTGWRGERICQHFADMNG